MTSSQHQTRACDFLVAGAGVAGICAALQAARLGLRTILVEKEMILGGNGGPNLGVGAHAAMSCNPYWNEMGIMEEIEEHINWRQARIFPTNFGYNIHPLWDEVVSSLLEDAGVRILRRHLVHDCSVENGIIRQVKLLNIENLDHVDVEIDGHVLDATGDAAKSFYQHWDFREMPGHPYRLFLSAKRLCTMMETPA